jgi:hypothetical protein
MLLAKFALGCVGALAMAAVYTFHEGVIRVDVDEATPNGSHVHVWVPATVVPVALHFAPDSKLRQAAEKAAPALPALHVLAKELRNYPDADFVDVEDGDDHVQVRTRNGKVLVDVHEPNTEVRVAVRMGTLDDVVGAIQSHAPGA